MDCCADSNCCEVSFILFPASLYDFSAVLGSRTLAAVGCCCFLVYSFGSEVCFDECIFML